MQLSYRREARRTDRKSKHETRHQTRYVLYITWDARYNTSHIVDCFKINLDRHACMHNFGSNPDAKIPTCVHIHCMHVDHAVMQRRLTRSFLPMPAPLSHACIQQSCTCTALLFLYTGHLNRVSCTENRGSRKEKASIHSLKQVTGVLKFVSSILRR